MLPGTRKHHNTPFFHIALTLIICIFTDFALASRSDYIEYLEQLTRHEGPVNEKMLIKLISRRLDKDLAQCDNDYVLPCAILAKKRLAVILPNTTCKDLSKKDTKELLASLSVIGQSMCIAAFRYGDPPYDDVKKIDWATSIYNHHLQKSYEVLDDFLVKFTSEKLRVTDFICGIKREILNRAYVLDFITELNNKIREMKISVKKEKIVKNVDQILRDLETCKMYTSAITPEILKKSLREQEMLCKVFAKVFLDNEEGLKLLVEIYTNAINSSDGISDVEPFKTPGSNFEKIFSLYEGYGETVAAGALRICLLDQNAVLDENSECITRLKEEEQKRRKALSDELAAKDAKKSKKTAQKRERATPKEKEAPIDEHSEEDVPRSIMEIKSDEKASAKHVCRYKLLRRVRRWGETCEAIKHCFDTSKDRRYSGQSLGKIKEQKDLHDLTEAIHILEEDDAGNYFFKTDRGVSALATLEVDGKVRKGIFEVGIRSDGCTIYHVVLNPRRVRMEKVLSPEFDDDKDISEGRCGNSKCSIWCKITKRRSCYIMTYVDPFDESHVYKRLIVHPYRSQDRSTAVFQSRLS